MIAHTLLARSSGDSHPVITLINARSTVIKHASPRIRFWVQRQPRMCTTLPAGMQDLRQVSVIQMGSNTANKNLSARHVQAIVAQHLILRLRVA